MSPADGSDAGTWTAARVADLYFTKYGRTSDVHDLQRVIDVLSSALEAAGGNDRYKPQIRHSLAFAWKRKYTKSGHIGDLTKARKAAYQDVAEGPLNKPHALAASWNNLSSIFLAAYDVSEDESELDLSMVAAMNAMQAYHSLNADPSPAQHRISRCLHKYFKRTKDADLLFGALHFEEDAYHENQRRRPGITQNLRANCDHWANLLEYLARGTRSSSVLRRAISHRQQLVKYACPPDCHCGTDIKVRLDLVRLLHWGYSEFSMPEYLEEALKRLEEAIKLCPSGHPDLAKCYIASNTINMARYEQTKEERFLEEAKKDMFKASQVKNVDPWSEIDYARAASADFMERSEYCMASKLLERAVRLIPLVSNRGMAPEVQQQRLSSLADLPTEACSATLAAGKSVEEALELLELGRGVILGYKIDSRSDFTILKEIASEKYEELLSVRARINATIGEAEDLPAWENQRQSALERWEKLLEEIRAIPALKDFLRPHSSNKLMELAAYGPIAVLNCTSIRADAIVITRKNIRAIPLDVPYEDLKKLALSMKDSITTGPPSSLGARNRDMNKMLAYLWKSVASPIAAELGTHLAPTGSGGLSRIWWIPVGLMSLMPIHAAGNWGKNEQGRFADIAISSYIPTIKALKYSREKSSMIAHSNPHKSILAVSMPTTPGEPDLAGLLKEVAFIEDSMKGISTRLLERPSTAHVLKELGRGFTFVHFACHGETKLGNAMDSNLLLVRTFSHTWVCDRCKSAVDLAWHCAKCNSGDYCICGDCIADDLTNGMNLHCQDESHLLQVKEAVDDYRALQRRETTHDDQGDHHVLRHPNADIIPESKNAEGPPTKATEERVYARKLTLFKPRDGPKVSSSREEQSPGEHSTSSSQKSWIETLHHELPSGDKARQDSARRHLLPSNGDALCYLDKMSKGRAFIHCPTNHQKERGESGAKPAGCKDFHYPFVATLGIPRARLSRRPDGTATHEILDRLTVRRLSKVVKENPSVLAYLSACSTARIVDKKLANESLHIASEFLLLGFVHVISTLWDANDRYATDVAVGFYTKLTEAIRAETLNDYKVARALHESVREVREKIPRNALS